MDNNDCLRRLRYILDLDDDAMGGIFSLAAHQSTREEICNMLKKEDDVDYLECTDSTFTAFLDGLIIHKRGPKEDSTEAAQADSKKRLTNNMIFRKLRIAFDLKAEDILLLLSQADCQISKHELSVFFRKPDNRKYRECKDQILRNFLAGLQLKHRPGEDSTKAIWDKALASKP